LIIKNVHISLLAVPLGAGRIRHPFFAGTALALPALRSSSSCARLSIAFSPAGVAAQPRPRKLAIMLVDICSFASCPSGIPGNRKRIMGRILSDIACISPASLATSITPTHRDMTPTMVMQRVTASLDEFSAASVTSCILPVNAPYTIPTKIIPPHR